MQPDPPIGRLVRRQPCYEHSMTWLAGVDSCRKGWFRVARNPDTGELRFDVLGGVAELLTLPPAPRVLALDIPIGLPARGARACDEQARAVLGTRRSSVFPAPIRPALAAQTRVQASEITLREDGRKVSVQAWALHPKISAVDELVRRTGDRRVREVHPEVCFWAWNGRRPMAAAKKTPAGKAERLALAESWLGPGILQRARGDRLKKNHADDDVLDAIAALWTAHRIADGNAETLPASPVRDDAGLPMEIVF